MSDDSKMQKKNFKNIAASQLQKVGIPDSQMPQMLHNGQHNGQGTPKGNGDQIPNSAQSFAPFSQEQAPQTDPFAPQQQQKQGFRPDFSRSNVPSANRDEDADYIHTSSMGTSPLDPITLDTIGQASVTPQYAGQFQDQPQGYPQAGLQPDPYLFQQQVPQPAQSQLSHQRPQQSYYYNDNQTENGYGANPEDFNDSQYTQDPDTNEDDNDLYYDSSNETLGQDFASEHFHNSDSHPYYSPQSSDSQSLAQLSSIYPSYTDPNRPISTETQKMADQPNAQILQHRREIFDKELLDAPSSLNLDPQSALLNKQNQAAEPNFTYVGANSNQYDQGIDSALAASNVSATDDANQYTHNQYPQYGSAVDQQQELSLSANQDDTQLKTYPYGAPPRLQTEGPQGISQLFGAMFNSLSGAQTAQANEPPTGIQFDAQYRTQSNPAFASPLGQPQAVLPQAPYQAPHVSTQSVAQSTGQPYAMGKQQQANSQAYQVSQGSGNTVLAKLRSAIKENVAIHAAQGIHLESIVPNHLRSKAYARHVDSKLKPMFDADEEIKASSSVLSPKTIAKGAFNRLMELLESNLPQDARDQDKGPMSYEEYIQMRHEETLAVQRSIQANQTEYFNDYMSQMRTSQQFDPAATFGRLTVDSLNYNAFNFALQFLNDINAHLKASLLLLLGGPGTGKSVLCNAIAQQFINLKSQGAVSSLRRADLPLVMLVGFNELISLKMFSFNDNIQDRIMRERRFDDISNVDLLIIDDVCEDCIPLSPFAQKILADLLSYRLEQNIPLVIATPLPNIEIANKLGIRSFERINSFEVIATCLEGVSRRPRAIKIKRWVGPDKLEELGAQNPAAFSDEKVMQGQPTTQSQQRQQNKQAQQGQKQPSQLVPSQDQIITQGPGQWHTKPQSVYAQNAQAVQNLAIEQVQRQPTNQGVTMGQGQSQPMGMAQAISQNLWQGQSMGTMDQDIAQNQSTSMNQTQFMSHNYANMEQSYQSTNQDINQYAQYQTMSPSTAPHTSSAQNININANNSPYGQFRHDHPQESDLDKIYGQSYQSSQSSTRLKKTSLSPKEALELERELEKEQLIAQKQELERYKTEMEGVNFNDPYNPQTMYVRKMQGGDTNKYGVDQSVFFNDLLKPQDNLAVEAQKLTKEEYADLRQQESKQSESLQQTLKSPIIDADYESVPDDDIRSAGNTRGEKKPRKTRQKRTTSGK